MPKAQQTKEQNKNKLSSYWETFCDGLVGQEEVKEQFRPIFNSLFYGMKYGFPDESVAGSVLLCGPTGVGKGEFARSLAKTFHGSHRNLLTISLGEYALSHEAARLLGAPPGYLGHRETQPMLAQGRINAVASEQCSYSFILWDEVEKAHPDIFNILLNILDRGEVRTSDGNKVNMERTFHIFTSNLGNKYQADQKAYLKTEEITKEARINKQKKEINKFFRKEFLGRITDQLFFDRFTKEELDSILTYEIEKIFIKPCAMLFSRKIDISNIKWTDEVKNEILSRANTEEFGAREIKSQLQKYLYTVGLEQFDKMIFPIVPEEKTYTLRFFMRGGEFKSEIIENEDQ
jgi:ATP-dependent Clp protease ATP-binding subunit ClpA